MPPGPWLYLGNVQVRLAIVEPGRVLGCAQAGQPAGRVLGRAIPPNPMNHEE